MSREELELALRFLIWCVNQVLESLWLLLCQDLPIKGGRLVDFRVFDSAVPMKAAAKAIMVLSRG